jgi:uracil-DNA glycosylase
MQVRIEESWKKYLKDEFEKPYFKELADFVRVEYGSGQIYPPARHIFRAFDACPFDQVKVVILGQDPYHGARQANGLCFAVNEGVNVPPSLQNIFKEIESDLGHEVEKSGDLLRWSEQGVLLLNATLTVRAKSPGSHQRRGWEVFTDAVIEQLTTNRENVVFLLWGNYAKEKGAFIDREKFLVLEAAHPSPYSAHHGFFGCKHFSQANEYLREYVGVTIEW